jgi:hypothetical protein
MLTAWKSGAKPAKILPTKNRCILLMYQLLIQTRMERFYANMVLFSVLMKRQLMTIAA